VATGSRAYTKMEMNGHHIKESLVIMTTSVELYSKNSLEGLLADRKPRIESMSKYTSVFCDTDTLDSKAPSKKSSMARY